MTVTLSLPMYLQFFNPNNTGAPAAGYLLFTYKAGTSTKQATWTDSTQTVQNANPIVLDSNGAAYVWLDLSLSYKFVFSPPNDTDPPTSPIRSEDNIQGPLTLSSLTGAVIGAALYPRTTAEIAAGVTPTNFSYPPLNPFRYGADGSGGAADIAALSSSRAVLAQLTNMGDWQNNVTTAGWIQSAAEATAGLIENFRYPGDSDGALNVFRFMTPAQINAVLSGANTTDVSGAIQAANDYLEGRAAGAILALNVQAGGSGYTNGFYPVVFMTGGTGGAGTPAKCAITVSGGAITSVVPSGPYVVNTSGVATGMANTHTANAAGYAAGGAYTVGDTLTPTTDNIATDPNFFPSGGSGAIIKVATISTAAGKTASGLPQGGRLFFPPGYYYCGIFSLRVGTFVRWECSSLNAVQFAWASGFTGQHLFLGPDESGFYGFTGYYTMGSVLESCTINCSSGASWGIFSDGIQQGSHIRDINVFGVVNGGISIKDNKGSVYFKMSDISVVGAAVMSLTSVAIKCALQSTIELNQITLNGGGSPSVATGCFATGIQVISGGHLISDYQCEECITGLDIAAGTGEYPQIIDRMLCTNTSVSTPRAIWIHAGFTGNISARGVTSGTGITAIQNDSTSYATSNGVTAAIPSYLWSGTLADLSIHEQVITSGVRESVTYVSGGTMRPDAAQGSSHQINVTTNAAFTIGPTLMSGAAMPSGALVGRRMSILIRNASGGVMGAITWDAVYKMSAWTNPAGGFSRNIDFEWNGANWIQISGVGVDVPN
jgi:hypothetical protein